MGIRNPLDQPVFLFCAQIPCKRLGMVFSLYDTMLRRFHPETSNSAVPRWAGAFSESLVRLHGTTATARKALEAGRLPDKHLGWRPITRGFGDVPAQPLPRLSGWILRRFSNDQRNWQTVGPDSSRHLCVVPPLQTCTPKARWDGEPDCAASRRSCLPFLPRACPSCREGR